MLDKLRKFEQLLAQQAEPSLGGTIDLFLLTMAPERARILRVAAIPHELDRGILALLCPEAGADAAYQTLGQLSFVLPASEKLVLHDDARAHLFKLWLEPEHLPEFQRLSALLAEHFRRIVESSQGTQRDRALNEQVFHVIGADHETGFYDLQDLLRERSRQYRLNDCTALIRLAHEYDPILDPEQRQVLAYQQARSAVDLRDFDRALELLKALLNDPYVSFENAIRARQLVAAIHTERHDFRAAQLELEAALQQARSEPEGARLIPGLLHDLGCAHRDQGNSQKAEANLEECIERARKLQDRAMVALAYNSLGTVWQRLGDIRKAIALYNQSLEALPEEGESFRRAQVYNNLATAFSEERDWPASEEWLKLSLEIKRAAGDTKGQAIALSNLVAVYRNLQDVPRALRVAGEAIALFDSVRATKLASEVRANLERLSAGQAEVLPATSRWLSRPELFLHLRQRAARAGWRRMPRWGCALLLLGVMVLWWLCVFLFRAR